MGTSYRPSTKFLGGCGLTIDFYNAHAQEFYDQSVNADMTSLYFKFLVEIPKGGSILDAGCGSGRDSSFFLKEGYNVISLDASSEMVRLSSNLLDRTVYQIAFQDLDFDNEFNGIWACASLLHVSRKEMDNVMNRLARALKSNGVIYASFKYGDKEEYRSQRFFNYYKEQSFMKLMERHHYLTMINTWVTEDVRKERQGELWFNVLMRRNSYKP